jgi:hypothetical protein
MIFIKRQNAGLNNQIDADFLLDVYLPVINLLPPL